MTASKNGIRDDDTETMLHASSNAQKPTSAIGRWQCRWPVRALFVLQTDDAVPIGGCLAIVLGN